MHEKATASQPAKSMSLARTPGRFSFLQAVRCDYLGATNSGSGEPELQGYRNRSGFTLGGERS